MWITWPVSAPDLCVGEFKQTPTLKFRRIPNNTCQRAQLYRERFGKTALCESWVQSLSMLLRSIRDHKTAIAACCRISGAKKRKTLETIVPRHSGQCLNPALRRLVMCRYQTHKPIHKLRSSVFHPVLLQMKNNKHSSLLSPFRLDSIQPWD